MGYSSIIDQDVYFVFLFYTCNTVIYLILHCHIAAVCLYFRFGVGSPDFLRRPAPRFQIEIEEVHPGPCPGQDPANSLSDPASPSGDNSRFTTNIKSHLQIFSLLIFS